jgi:predicted secreted protein
LRGGERISKRKPDNVLAFKFKGGTRFGQVVDMVDFVGEFAKTIIKAKMAVEITQDDNLGKWLHRMSVCQVIFTDTIYPTSGNVIGPVVHQPLAA